MKYELRDNIIFVTDPEGKSKEEITKEVLAGIDYANMVTGEKIRVKALVFPPEME